MVNSKNYSTLIATAFQRFDNESRFWPFKAANLPMKPHVQQQIFVFQRYELK